MNKMKHILLLLPMAMLLAACTQDELTDNGQGTPLPEPVPLQLTASLGEAIATPVTSATRATVDGTWTGNETVYVQIVSNKDANFTSEADIDWANVPPIQYTINSSGNMALKDQANQVYWQATDETFYIRAWYAGTGEAYTNIPISDNSNTWSTPQKQSTPEALNRADFLFAYQSLSFDNRTQAGLAFKHLTSRITINLIDSEYLGAQPDGDVSVALVATTPQGWHYGGSFTGSNTALSLEKKQEYVQTTDQIIPYQLLQPNSDAYATYRAVVIPQTITDTGKAIQVKVGRATYQWMMTLNENQLFSGNEYTFNITVDAKGLGVQVDTNIDWETGGASGSGSVTLP